MLSAGHVAVCFVLICVQIQAFNELVNLRYVEAKEKDMPLFRSLQWAWFAVAMFYAHGSSWLKAPMGFDETVFQNFLKVYLPAFTFGTNDHMAFFEFLSFGLFVSVFILSVLSLRKGLYDYQITQFMWTIAILLLVVLQMKTLVSNVYNGLFWFVFPFLCVVVNDVAAYFSGITLGKRVFKDATFFEFVAKQNLGRLCWSIYLDTSMCLLQRSFSRTSLWLLIPVSKKRLCWSIYLDTSMRLLQRSFSRTSLWL